MSERHNPPQSPNKGDIRRRDFVAGSLAAGAGLAVGAAAWKAWSQGIPAPIVPIECVPPVPFGQAAAFASASGPVRVRKSVFELDSGEITRLKAAYTELQKLTRDNDPRTWYRQGAVHCWYCSGAVDSLNGMEIHGGWWFLPWHRAYLYFHERILGSLIGDPNFALPYWDWDSCTDDPKDMTGRNRFPFEIYGSPQDTPLSPLFDSTRAAVPNDRMWTSIVGPTPMRAILGSKSFGVFGGSGDESLPVFSQTDPQQAGQLESGPHGYVHLWTTDPNIRTSGISNMGVLASAAFDPVFFAHHANIDRLWSKWAAVQGHANPSNGRWLSQQPFYFYDQAQTWVSILVQDVIDHEASLSYRYQPPKWPPGAPPATTGAAPRQSETVRTAQVEAPSAPLITLDTNTEAKALLPQPTTLQVAVPQEAKQRIAAVAAGASTLVLRIDGVEIPVDRGATVQVFINRPDVTAPAKAPEPGYVGSIVIVPSTSTRPQSARTTVTRNFVLPLSREEATALSGKDNLAVTLLPVTGDKKPPQVLHYRRVYLASQS
jgi:polyphenol oxidase